MGGWQDTFLGYIWKENKGWEINGVGSHNTQEIKEQQVSGWLGRKWRHGVHRGQRAELITCVRDVPQMRTEKQHGVTSATSYWGQRIRHLQCLNHSWEEWK